MLLCRASAEQFLWYNGGFVNFAPQRAAGFDRRLRASSIHNLGPAQGKGQSECTNGKPGAVSFSLTQSRNIFKLAFNSARYLI